MPQPHSEDPDPLLSFSVEPGASVTPASPPEPAVQPVVPAADPPAGPRQPPPSDLLISRIDRLERALDDSRSQVSSLKSEVTTLVRALGDIRRQLSQRPLASGTSPRPREARSASRAAAAIAGILIGASAGIFGWMHLSDDADVTIAAPAPESGPPRVADPSPAIDALRPSETPKALVAATSLEARKAPKAPKAPEAPKAPRYVGTLSIDAAPGGEVFLNRQSAGRTPLRLPNLRAGSHLIWIERDGYRRWTRVVQVNADSVSRVSADLEPLPAR